jgi:Zn-dependent peptidase ImmA (M78 family)
MSPGELAESLVAELGLTQAQELDVEAIAFDSGVSVIYEQGLQGCEATLIGYADQAIATIKPSSVRGRERFSVAHEVGHWILHRGRSFRCRVEEVEANLEANADLEKEADLYAAHLLMPSQIFKPAIRALARPSFDDISSLKNLFETSRLATCLRLTGLNAFPVIIAGYTVQGLRWQARSKDVPRRWWLQPKLDADSFAYDLMNHGKLCQGAGKQAAETWFTNDDADKFEVLEECTPGRSGEVLVLLNIIDGEMLDAGFDRDLLIKRTRA